MKKYILLAGVVFVSAMAIGQKPKNAASEKVKIITHEVAAKEGLYSIARKYGVAVADIAKANGFDKDQSLTIGQKIKIPVTGQKAVEVAKKAEKHKVEVEKKSTKSGKAATITGTNINIRKGPATDQEVVGIAQQGDVVTLLKKVNDEWSSVRTKDGVEGYVATRFLQSGTATEPKAETKPAPVKPSAVKTARISGTDINIRKGPATDQEVVGIGQLNDEVEVLKNVNSEWASIRTKDGTEGFIASRFLKTGPVTNAPKPTPKMEAKPTLKTATVSGTNINVRKGPGSDQEVIAQAQPGDVIKVVKKVNDEWSQVTIPDGTEGFLATRFLTNENVGDNTPVAKAEEQQVNSVVDKVGKKVEEKQSIEKAAAKPVLTDAGYFKTDYDKNTNPNITSESTVTSGIFKTDKGWSDGRYYMLMDNAAPGTIVKIINPENNKTVYAKVLGKMQGVQYSDGFDVRISEAAAKKLNTGNPDKFSVKVVY